MELRQRNNGRTMITFHSQQSDCARRARKNENAGTFNFVSQIALPICTVMHSKRVKTDATIFRSWCSRTVVCCRFYRVDALPLSQAKVLRLANGSSKIARSPARRSRDVHATSGKFSGKMSCAFPCNFPAMTGQRQMQSSRITCRTTRKTTCLTPGLDAQQPCHSRAMANTTSRKRLVVIPSSAFNHHSPKL
jgi:hypothetical protein